MDYLAPRIGPDGVRACCGTGRGLRDEELHLWTFDDAGRVVRFRRYMDTAKHLQAAELLQAA